MKRVQNPPNPFHSTYREFLEPPPDARLTVYEDSTRSILSRNDSPDVGFRWSLNPYRGCFHSCAYCYAREYHTYLDLGAGTDFESNIAVKKNAAPLLKNEFEKKSWKGEIITFSGATDCYQPLEAVYHLTRSCLEVCRDYRNPVCLITKGFLVVRDADLIVDLHRRAYALVIVSIPFANEETARKIEPQASTVERRFKAVELLSKKGIPTGVSLAPTIPGLNENDIPLVMKRAKDCGAVTAFHTHVRLSKTVRPVFEQKIKEALPGERVTRILNRLTETRRGNIEEGRVGIRMKGTGTYWKAIHDMFQLAKKKYGLDEEPDVPSPSPFKRPAAQMELSF